MHLFKCTKCHLAFSTTRERIDHIAFSPMHFPCDICIKRPGSMQPYEFDSAEALQSHWEKQHCVLYCKHCDIFLATLTERVIHDQNQHSHFCLTCGGGYIPTLDLLEEHYKSAEHRENSVAGEARTPKAAPEQFILENIPDHYATLRISPNSTHEEIVKAAKEMRIQTHPDRMKRQVGLTEEQNIAIDTRAALVGQAADVLSNPDLRREYDLKSNEMCSCQ